MQDLYFGMTVFQRLNQLPEPLPGLCLSRNGSLDALFKCAVLHVLRYQVQFFLLGVIYNFIQLDKVRVIKFLHDRHF